MKRAVMFSGFLLGLAVLGGCGNQAAESPTAQFPEPAQGYRCEDGFRFVIQPAGDLVSLTTPSVRMLNLTREDAEDGERYVDSRSEFLRRDGRVILMMDGRTHRDCAALMPDEPYDFQASGFEPGWMVEIDSGEAIHFIGDYGDLEVTVPAPEPEFHPKTGAVTYQAEAEGNRLAVVIRDEVCYEASGDPAPTTVTVRLGEREYTGCGTSRPPMQENYAKG